MSFERTIPSDSGRGNTGLPANQPMNMQQPIHASGLKLSRISAGMWRLGEWNKSVNDLTGWIEECIDIGVTTFDHADIYGDYECEKIFGEVLARRPELRSKMELVTKCGICLISDKKQKHRITHYDLSADHVINSVNQSLRNLHTDYLDLLLIHRPSPLMDADATAAGLKKVIDSGKVRFAGVSNFTPSQMNLLQSRLEFPLVTNQIEFSLLHTAPLFDGTLDHLQTSRTRPMVWSPYGGGKIFTGTGSRESRIQQSLQKFSVKYDVAPDAIALAWILKHPSKPFPALGTGKMDRVKRALDGYSLDLELQDWFELLEASMGEPVP